MKSLATILACSTAFLLCGCAPRAAVADTQSAVEAEFVGSTPGDPLVRNFLGGLAADAACHSIVWQLELLTNRNSASPSTFTLTALHRIPTQANPNRSEDGPRVTLHGTWEIGKGTHARHGELMYQLNTANPKRTLSFAKISDHLIHLLNPDGTLAIGNGGESYTLNRADHAEKSGDTMAAVIVPDMSYKISTRATGSNVFGLFEGRSPCHGISRDLAMPQHPGCIKIKWRVTLFQDLQTLAPSTCKLEGTLFRDGAREGAWRITRGAATDPNATVYELHHTPNQLPLLLMKGDNNVLFFLNQKREPLVGHAEFSYTLNRMAAK